MLSRDSADCGYGGEERVDRYAGLIEDLVRRVQKLESVVFVGNGQASLVTRMAVLENTLEKLDEMIARLERVEESNRQRSWQLIVALGTSFLMFVFNLVLFMLRGS